MSEPMRCEKCRKEGRRRRGAFCPEGWLFFETLVDHEEPEQGVTIVVACSKECADALWETGPGNLFRQTPYPPEHQTPPPRRVKGTTGDWEKAERDVAAIDGREVNGPVDMAIRPLVATLMALGFPCFCSCAGHPEDEKKNNQPWIDLRMGDDPIVQELTMLLCRFYDRPGFPKRTHNLTLSVHPWKPSGPPEKHAFVRIINSFTPGAKAGLSREEFHAVLIGEMNAFSTWLRTQ